MKNFSLKISKWFKRSIRCYTSKIVDNIISLIAIAPFIFRAVEIKKSDFLYVDYKYVGGDKRKGISDFSLNLISSFDEYNNINDKKFILDVKFIDELRKKTFANQYLFVKYVFSSKPRYIIFNPGLLADNSFCTVLLFTILNKKGFDFISLNTDANGFESVNKLCDIFSKFATLNIILDSYQPPQWVQDKNKFKFKCMPAPYPQEWYLTVPKDRDIDISFIGCFSDSKLERKEYINYLLAKGIAVYVIENDGYSYIPREQYINYLLRSKITINFSGNSNLKYHQIKGRVFEATLSGCLLLEYDNLETSNLFESYIEYVPFSSKIDLYNKILFYLNNVDEIDKIASKGKIKSLANYTGNHFWDKIVQSLKNT
ncbi:MAG: glycosyltransferase family 1 protein [SAR324 cluster bacterium]|nr:glycosyltransferase family 1 protein [SAR324 cluster bacterium]